MLDVDELNYIAVVEYLPAISIIFPVTPVTTLKKVLEYRMKNVMGKVEATLGHSSSC